MTISFPAWAIPAAMTAAMLLMMLRPYSPSSLYDFGPLFRLLWLIPILGTWVIYLGVLVWMR
jgi:hypothetical protein